jgi:hypothetical protein
VDGPQVEAEEAEEVVKVNLCLLNVSQRTTWTQWTGIRKMNSRKLQRKEMFIDKVT